ncbi:hypothetical protein KI387_010425, partial [Taxus chinensis]
ICFMYYQFCQGISTSLTTTSDLGWKEYQRGKPIVIDPGLYLSRKSEILYASQKREMPDAYKAMRKDGLSCAVHDRVETVPSPLSDCKWRLLCSYA